VAAVCAMALFGVACGGDNGGDPTPADVVSDTPDAVELDTSTDVPTELDDTPEPEAPPEPVIHTVSPASSSIRGDISVTIRGTEFRQPCRVVFGTQDALASSVVSDRIIDARVPPGEAGGSVDVRVGCRNGTAVLTDGFRYDAPEVLAITSLSPDVGSTLGGDRVVASGTAIVSGARNLVAVGGQPARDLEFGDDASTLTFTTPAASQPGRVSVTFDLGGTVVVRPDSFLYLDPVEIDDIIPHFGDVGGGDEVRITGDGLVRDIGLVVRFGDNEADPESYEFDEDGITLAAPAGEGTVDVHIVTPLGTVTRDEAFTYVALIDIDEVTPTAVLQGDTQRVTIRGTGFDAPDEGDLEITINGESAFSIDIEDATTVSFIPPQLDPGTYPIVISRGVQSIETETSLRVVAQITLSDITPASGDVTENTRVTIDGSGFAPGMTVFFGATQGIDLDILSPNSLRVTAPPRAEAGAVDVIVRNLPAIVVRQDAFTYTDSDE